MTYSLIVSSGAPVTYVALMLPSVLTLTVCFMLGAILCLVLEILNARDARQVLSSFPKSYITRHALAPFLPT